MWFEHSLIHLLNRLGTPRIAPARGLNLGAVVDHDHETVMWPHEERAQHACIVGKSGSGKTHCCLWIAHQLMTRREPVIFFDYHGDATNELIGLAAQHPDLAERLVIVDPTDPEMSPGLNPLEAAVADESEVFARASELATILRQRWDVAAFGARTDELLRNTLFVLSATGQTLVDIPRFLTNTPYRVELLSRVNQTDILDYWRTRFEPLSDKMKAVFREPLLNKVTEFLTEPACRHFLGQQSTFTFAQAIEARSIILISLAKGKLRERAHTLGNLIFAKLQFEILARAALPIAQRRLVTVFCDEVQNLGENDLTTLLAEGRKFQVSLVTGHQFWDQLSRELRGALLSAGTHLIFRVSAADAAILSPELSVVLRHRYHQGLTELPRGEAVVRVGASSPRAILVPGLPGAAHTQQQLAVIRQQSLARVSRRRTEIEAEIRRHRQTLTTQPTNDYGQQHW